MNDPYIGKLFLTEWHPPNPNIINNTEGTFLFMVMEKTITLARADDNINKEVYLCESLTSGQQYIYNEYEIIRGLVSYKNWKEQNNV